MKEKFENKVESDADRISGVLEQKMASIAEGVRRNIGGKLRIEKLRDEHDPEYPAQPYAIIELEERSGGGEGDEKSRGEIHIYFSGGNIDRSEPELVYAGLFPTNTEKRGGGIFGGFEKIPLSIDWSSEEAEKVTEMISKWMNEKINYVSELREKDGRHKKSASK